MTSFLTYAFRVSSNSTPISTSRKYPKISSRPCTGISPRGGFQISSAISTPKCTVESNMTTTSIPASAITVNFWTAPISLSNTISFVLAARAMTPAFLLAASTVPSSAGWRGGILVAGSGEYFRRLLLVLGSQLLRPQLIVQLVNGSSELERDVIAEIYRRAGINPDIECLVYGHKQRNRVSDCLAGDLGAVHQQHSRTTLGGPRSVVFEVEDDRVFACAERRQPLPAETLQIEEVVTNTGLPRPIPNRSVANTATSPNAARNKRA